MAELFFSLTASALIAIVGWGVVHRLAAKRDSAAKRRDTQVAFLIDAYRRLERASNAASPEARFQDLESSIADIQLFGSRAQVRMAADFVRAFAANG